MNRKRPEGQEFVDWCREWDAANHIGKIALCEKFGVQFDTAKHWRSDSGIPNLVKETLATSAPEPPEELGIDDLIGEILATRPRIDLDFVTFDIETSNLKADFSILLSAVIKPFNFDPFVFRADEYDSWTANRTDDAEICRDISEELSRHAIVITHYGSRFDLPFLRAKMTKYGLPPLPPMFGIDTYSIARYAFQVSSRRLKNLVEYFELGEKGGVEGRLWMKAAYSGDSEALDEIVQHNIIDCEVLERLAAISFPYLKAMRRI